MSSDTIFGALGFFLLFGLFAAWLWERRQKKSGAAQPDAIGESVGCLTDILQIVLVFPVILYNFLVALFTKPHASGAAATRVPGSPAELSQGGEAPAAAPAAMTPEQMEAARLPLIKPSDAVPIYIVFGILLALVVTHRGAWGLLWNGIYLAAIGGIMYTALSRKEYLGEMKRKRCSFSRRAWMLQWLVGYGGAPIIAWLLLGLPALLAQIHALRGRG